MRLGHFQLHPRPVAPYAVLPCQHNPLDPDPADSNLWAVAYCGICECDLSAHGPESDSVWVAVHGDVYDLTSFLDTHPGGRASLLSVAGTDGTAPFLAYHSAGALERVAALRLGPLAKQLRAAGSNNADNSASARPAIPVPEFPSSHASTPPAQSSWLYYVVGAPHRFSNVTTVVAILLCWLLAPGSSPHGWVFYCAKLTHLVSVIIFAGGTLFFRLTLTADNTADPRDPRVLGQPWFHRWKSLANRVKLWAAGSGAFMAVALVDSGHIGADPVWWGVLLVKLPIVFATFFFTAALTGRCECLDWVRANRRGVLDWTLACLLVVALLCHTLGHLHMVKMMGDED